MVTAIVNGTLIDGTGGDPLPGGTILVEGDRIAAVGPGSRVGVPPAAKLFDTAGRTVLPGFIDCHVHQTYRDHDLRRHLMNPPTYNLLRSTSILRATLEAGVTTCRDLSGADVGLRRAIDEGFIFGPRLLVSIVMISQTGGHADSWVPAGVRVPKRPWLPDNIADGVDGVRRVTREILRAGADLVKISASGGITSPSDEYWEAQFSVEEIQASVYEAGVRGKRVAAHAEGLAGIKNALRAGVHSIEHGWFLDEECIDLMLAQGTFWVPTLAMVPLAHRRRRQDPAWASRASDSEVRKDEEIYERQQQQHPLWNSAVERGVRVAMGTDQSARLLVGENLVELEFMVSCLGLSPMQAIVASTKAAAECLERPELGTLEPGKMADIVVVDGDPLADIRVLQDPNRIQLVLKAGLVQKDLLPVR